MPTPWKPSPEVVRAFTARQATLDLSYAAVGATANVPPAGYVVDHTRAWVGAGAAAFEAGKAALARWDHFRLGWVEAVPDGGGIRVGGVVAVVARTFGAWWLNACRIVYLVDEEHGPVRRWGFAYGTLPGHAETGEERFLIEWDRGTGDVWYDVLAFSRPRHLLARLGYPVARRFQKRFARDSVAAVTRAVAASVPPPPPTAHRQ
ncbi:MAG TPA: DUF1990 domain-containing protein [Humisphaera sp.]